MAHLPNYTLHFTISIQNIMSWPESRNIYTFLINLFLFSDKKNQVSFRKDVSETFTFERSLDGKANGNQDNLYHH